MYVQTSPRTFHTHPVRYYETQESLERSFQKVFPFFNCAVTTWLADYMQTELVDQIQIPRLTTEVLALCPGCCAQGDQVKPSAGVWLP